jgi:predicted amidohydrolase
MNIESGPRPEHLKVGALQMACEYGRRESNVNRALEILSAGEDADLVVLPELLATGYALDERLFDQAETIPGPTTDSFAGLAAASRTAIVGGIAERDSAVAGVLYDSVFVIDSSGELVGRYRKTHLYPAEHAFFRPGSTLGVFEVDGICLGVAICFEHAFPAIFTEMALQGAEVMVIPSAVPVGYQYLLDLRTRARAQDNQCFVIASNLTGPSMPGSRTVYCGASKIVGPKGQALVEADNVEQRLLTAEVAFAELRAERRQEPTLRCRRPELYRSLCASDGGS